MECEKIENKYKPNIIIIITLFAFLLILLFSKCCFAKFEETIVLKYSFEIEYPIIEGEKTKIDESKGI